MKKQTGVWIDGKKAIIVTIQGNHEQKEIINSKIENRIYHFNEGDKGDFMGDHHLNQERKFEERKKHQIQNFLAEVTNKIKDTDEIYAFGPATTKLKLKGAIEHNRILSKKPTHLESAGQMTMNQIVAKVKNHFKA